MGQFIYFILHSLISLMILAIIISAVISWLVAFDVINLRNRAAHQIAYFFDAVTRPILMPFQKVIPSLGGVDISPLIALLVLEGVDRYLLPLVMTPIIRVLG